MKKLFGMKSVFALSFLISILSIISCKWNDADEISVMTFNIRFDNPRDGINAWPGRKQMIFDLLKSEKPDLFGLQEALSRQYRAIDSAMTGYSSVAAGRDDGKDKGEMNPLFYNKEVFDYVRDSTFWLSPTPDIPGSRGWGASLPRIVTWVELEYRKTGKPFFCFNTHFAHDSDSARIMSAEILLREVKRIAGKSRLVITGDFNMLPESRAYSILTEKDSQYPFLADTHSISEDTPSGPAWTFNGWSDEKGEGRIDFIFVRNGMKTRSMTTILKKEGPVFVSDHWPVEAVILID